MSGVEPEILFGPYRLDRGNARLVRGRAPVALTPKAFDVLHYLASRPDRLVTKEELLSAVWPDVVVSDASVKVCVREIRKALDDGPKTPRYIETVHRRGYRFIGLEEGTEAGSGGPPNRRRASPGGGAGAGELNPETPSRFPFTGDPVGGAPGGRGRQGGFAPVGPRRP